MQSPWIYVNKTSSVRILSTVETFCKGVIYGMEE